MPPIATALIAAFGWRDAYLVLGVVVAIVGVGAAALIEDDPRQRGLRPDGGTPETAPSSQSVKGLSVKEAVRTPRFLGLYAACLVGSLGAFVPFVHLVPYAVDHKLEPTMAALLLSARSARSVTCSA